MNDENQGEKKEGRPRRRFPRRRRSGGNTEGRSHLQPNERRSAAEGEKGEPVKQQKESQPSSTGSDGLRRNSQPPHRPSRAPEGQSALTQKDGRKNLEGGARSKANRRRNRSERPQTDIQTGSSRQRGQDTEGQRARRNHLPGDRSQGGDRSTEQSDSRLRNSFGERASSHAPSSAPNRVESQRRAGMDADPQDRRDTNRYQADSALPSYADRDSRRLTFRDSLQKKDSLLPEPFLYQEEYSEVLEQETAGYEGMTNEQLTFLKTTSITDEIPDDEGGDNFAVPDNAVLMDVAGIKLHHADPVLMFDSKDIHLENGDRVVVETKKGLALGEVLLNTRRQFVKQHNLPRVIRKMSQGDLRQEERNREKEQAAFQLCKERIERLRLPMKLIEVEYLHGGNKAVFYFSAEGRVDFRELVRDLAQRLHTRIEMRQIGVRDVSRIVGGVGICGCQLCCSLYLREFKPISIRMAKDQNLVLNPQKVSGVCGRLLCCLTYENEVYQKAAQSMPRVGRRVFTPDGEGRIRDRDVLKRIIRVQLNEETQIREYHVDEIDLGSGRNNDDIDNGVEDEMSDGNGLEVEAMDGDILLDENSAESSWNDDDSSSQS